MLRNIIMCINIIKFIIVITFNNNIIICSNIINNILGNSMTSYCLQVLVVVEQHQKMSTDVADGAGVGGDID
eukprot:UN04905